MDLKFYRVDVPTAQLTTFFALAESEGEAISLITAALDGHQDAKNRVEILQTSPILDGKGKQVRTAEPGSLEERKLRKEQIFPSFSLFALEVLPDEK